MTALGTDKVLDNSCLVSVLNDSDLILRCRSGLCLPQPTHVLHFLSSRMSEAGSSDVHL